MKFSEGQTALPFVILIGGIIIEIAIAGALIAFFINSAALGERLSARAFSAANTGIQDAAVRISGNKNLITASYSINLGEDSVSVNITRDALSDNFIIFTATSTATARDRQKTLTAEFIVEKKTGKTSLSYLQ